MGDIPEGMKEWPGNGRCFGEEYECPKDYTGGPVMYRCGQIDPCPSGRTFGADRPWDTAEWRHDNAPFDIIAYTPSGE